MKMFRGSQIQTVFLVIMFIILVSSAGGTINLLLSTGDFGYSTAFQGPKASFVGVQQASSKKSITPSTVLNYDVDEWNTGAPNIVGEMTSVFVPEQSTSFLSWKSFEEWTQWLSGNSYITNPQETYEWEINNKSYVMEQWLMKFYISFSAEGHDDEIPRPEMPGEIERNYVSNVKVWIEFDISPTWYIEGGGTAYFAIGSIRVSNVKKQAIDNNGVEHPVNTQMSVSPESVQAGLYIYYAKWGAQSAEVQVSTYQGKELNSDFFRDKVYAYFGLNNFGITGWNEMFAQKSKGDVITIGFDVTVFVIGEWDVKDVQLDEGDFGRTTKVTTVNSIFDYLSDTRIQALIALLATAGVLIVILIFAPWILISIVSIFRGGSSRRK